MRFTLLVFDKGHEMSHTETLIGIIHDTGTDEKIFFLKFPFLGISPFTEVFPHPIIHHPKKIGSDLPKIDLTSQPFLPLADLLIKKAPRFHRGLLKFKFLTTDGGWRILALTKSNTGAGHIIRGHFHGDMISQQDANVVLAHFTSQIREHFMTVIKPHAELCSRKSFNHKSIHFNFAFFFCHTRLLNYSLSLKARLLMRRIAFFFSIRRVSLLEMNQRLLRMVPNMPLFTIFLRKRLSKES
jgi:hypothetical protein